MLFLYLDVLCLGCLPGFWVGAWSKVYGLGCLDVSDDCVSLTLNPRLLDPKHFLL